MTNNAKHAGFPDFPGFSKGNPAFFRARILEISTFTWTQWDMIITMIKLRVPQPKGKQSCKQFYACFLLNRQDSCISFYGTPPQISATLCYTASNFGWQKIIEYRPAWWTNFRRFCSWNTWLHHVGPYISNLCDWYVQKRTYLFSEINKDQARNENKWKNKQWETFESRLTNDSSIV